MSNNRVFVLQKDLPDSKAGDEYIWNESQKAYYLNGNILGSYWRGDAIENNSDWFIEKKEQPKEWEIVAYNYYSISEIVKKYGTYWWDSRHLQYSEDELKKVASIHSVKRLSDGEVFSVGDECIISRYIVDSFVIKDFFTNELNQIFVNSEKGKWNVMALVKTNPSVKEDGFIWDDKSVSDFCNYMAKPRVPWANSIMEEKMEKFKQSKSAKEDKIEVMDLYFNSTNPIETWYSLATNKSIPEEKYEPIKQAIEQVLNQ